jgi:hypothetical protein
MGSNEKRGRSEFIAGPEGIKMLLQISRVQGIEMKGLLWPSPI